MKKAVSLFGVLSLCFLVSCQPSGTRSLVRELTTGIMNGRNLKDGEKLTTGVVAIWDDEEKAICTGSLLDNNTVVTAAHCLTSRPAVLRVIFSLTPYDVIDAREPDVMPTYSRRVTSYKVHEHYAVAEEEGLELDRGDIGILKFAGEIPEGYRPATLLADVNELTKKKMVTMVGYGVDTVDTIEIDVRKTPRAELEEREEAGEITCDDKMTHCMEIEMSGDGILRVAQAPIAALHETEVRLDETRQGTCSGDSGGPAYLENNGTYYLFGITSRGNLFCSTTGVYTNILSYTDWLAEASKTLK